MTEITFIRDPLQVLIIEDNPVDQKVLLSMLKDFPRSVSHIETAATLLQAQALLAQFQFDVAIVDLNLTDSSGEKTLETITRLAPAMAIVVSTGAYEDDLGLRTLSKGAQDFLVKSRYTAYVLNKALHYSVERKRLEVSLQKAYDDLKDTQESLVKAEKMRVVGALASGVAHEVKNPLATIMYGVTYLKENLTPVDEKVDVVLTTIHEATERANNIIMDLLDFSSMSKLNKSSTDMNALIGKALQLSQHELESHHIKIERSGLVGPVNLIIDSNRIEQVLINIFLNAVHAMRSAGVLTIDVSQFKVAPTAVLYSKLKSSGFSLGDSVVMVSIGDTGKGIPHEQLNKVFEPFFTTRRAQGGVGLGLAVAKNIMDLHGGLIFFDNKPEGGALVRIVFPMNPRML